MCSWVLTEVQLFQVRLLLYGKCFEISLANLNLTVISFSISTKVGKLDEISILNPFSLIKGGCLCLLPPAWTVSQWRFSIKGAIVMINRLVIEWVKRGFYVLLPKEVKFTSTFIFKVDFSLWRLRWLWARNCGSNWLMRSSDRWALPYFKDFLSNWKNTDILCHMIMISSFGTWCLVQTWTPSGGCHKYEKTSFGDEIPSSQPSVHLGHLMLENTLSTL